MKRLTFFGALHNKSLCDMSYTIVPGLPFCPFLPQAFRVVGPRFRRSRLQLRI
jgi:hypothetical protein